MKYLFIFFGIAFGFLMSRAGATNFDFYAQLFLFENLQLLWVIVFAVITGMSGIFLLKRLNLAAVINGAKLTFTGKPKQKGLVAGALMFGVGWGLAGTCPGSAAVMLGEGKLIVLAAMLGMLCGTYMYGWVYQRRYRSTKNVQAFSAMADSA